MELKTVGEVKKKVIKKKNKKSLYTCLKCKINALIVRRRHMYSSMGCFFFVLFCFVLFYTLLTIFNLNAKQASKQKKNKK